MKLSYAVPVLAWYLGASTVATGQDPPPKPLEFYGYTMDARGTPLRAFFREAGKIYIAAAGDLVDERYRVVRISVDSAVVEDTSGTHRQTLPLAARNPNTNSAVIEKIPSVARSVIPLSTPLAVTASAPPVPSAVPDTVDRPAIPRPPRLRRRR